LGKKVQKGLSFAANLLLLQGFAPGNERAPFIEDWYNTEFKMGGVPSRPLEEENAMFHPNKEDNNSQVSHTDLADQELERRKAQYGDGNTLDPQKALEYILHVGFYRAFQTPEVVEGDHVYLPDWDITITPVVSQLSEGGVVLDFYIDSPAWGKPLYECCAAPGSTTGQAMGLALASFQFCFMQGIARMQHQEEPKQLETLFAGKTHRWKAYPSDLVATGEKTEPVGPTLYWDALKDEIVKRLGNQKLCYVKIYAAKIGGEVIGECRVDDWKSEELSALVAGMASKWDVKGYASHKQFIFLRQEEETTLPSPYWGSEGHTALLEKVRQAVDLLRAADTNEKYDMISTRLAQQWGDRTLAQECHLFLPEICAEIALGEKVRLAEQVGLAREGKAPVLVYKTQLCDYYALHSAINHLFQSGVYGEETNQIFRQLVGLSATYSGLCQAQKKESTLENLRQGALLFPVSEDFEIR